MARMIDIEDEVATGFLEEWYIHSVDNTQEPIWTEAHIHEISKDFIILDRVMEVECSELSGFTWQVTEGYPHNLYCPLCHGTNVWNIDSLKMFGVGKPKFPTFCMWCGTKMDLK